MLDDEKLFTLVFLLVVELKPLCMHLQPDECFDSLCLSIEIFEVLCVSLFCFFSFLLEVSKKWNN